MASNAVLLEEESETEPEPSTSSSALSGRNKKTDTKERKLWSVNEQLCLVEGVKANYAILEGKFSATLSYHDKKVSNFLCAKLLKWGPTV